MICVCVGVWSEGKGREVVISGSEKSRREGRRRGGERYDELKHRMGKQGGKDAQIEGESSCVLTAIKVTWIYYPLTKTLLIWKHIYDVSTRDG